MATTSTLQRDVYIPESVRLLQGLVDAFGGSVYSDCYASHSFGFPKVEFAGISDKRPSAGDEVVRVYDHNALEGTVPGPGEYRRQHNGVILKGEYTSTPDETLSHDDLRDLLHGLLAEAGLRHVPHTEEARGVAYLSSGTIERIVESGTGGAR